MTRTYYNWILGVTSGVLAIFSLSFAFAPNCIFVEVDRELVGK